MKRLCLYLIKPSKYDDDGYVIRHWRGVLPSNTLACLYGLTEAVRTQAPWAQRVQWQVRVIDETVQRVHVRAILRRAARRDTRTIVCLAGVQSNQFARARDLALALRTGGVAVLIGGFHVSGSLALLPTVPSEIQQLLDAGVTVVAGEVEGRWEGLLEAAWQGTLQPLYNFLQAPPALEDAPLPQVPPGYVRRFVAHNFATLDCGRGCPFACSFCTVINVQGRTMRFRRVEHILETIRANARQGISYYFFTDDNFCRNRHWEAILDGLIRLRQGEGLAIGFMVQVDTQSYKLPRFIEKVKAAGCSQVFIGMESLNPENLAAAGKRQNRIEEFQALLQAYRHAGINTHVAYILGFPFDDRASIRQDVARLCADLTPQQASFFMLTPLPGSRDHAVCVQQGQALDADLNRYDSFHATTAHPRMSRGAWAQAYRDAWATFYSRRNMIRILRRTAPANYWAVFANFIWYKNAIEVEQGHPMIEGFVRLKRRDERRPELPQESWGAFTRRRVADVWQYATGWPRLALEMEDVWLQTRSRSAAEERVVAALRQRVVRARHWRRLRHAELQALYHRAAVAMPAWWQRRWNPCAQALTWSRAPLRGFWRAHVRHWRQGRWDQVDLGALLFNSLQELALFTWFARTFFVHLLRRLLLTRAVKST